MPNIAILTHGLPPTSIGGTQTQSAGWAAVLSGDHRVTVVTRRNDPGEPLREKRDGFDVLRVPRASLPYWRSASEIRGIRRYLAGIEPRPDVLLCFGSALSGLAGVRAGRSLGIPAVVWLRDEAEYQLRNSWLTPPDYRLTAPWVWEHASSVLIQTEIARSALLTTLHSVSPRREAIVREKLQVIGNGIEIPDLAAWDPDGPVLSVGRLVAIKGMDVVIEACAAAGRSLVIAGDGPQRTALAALAAERQADVRFTGFLGREALAELYRQASAVVLASQSEGLPNVVLEAMAHGRPVVTTPVGGVPDLIEADVNGLLISPGDTEGLVAALKRLSLDPELASRLASAARASVMRFEWNRLKPQLEAVLERCRQTG